MRWVRAFRMASGKLHSGVRSDGTRIGTTIERDRQDPFEAEDRSPGAVDDKYFTP